MFHKQSILTHSSEIVTNAQLQNYLDAMTAHVERQFADKVDALNSEMNTAMNNFKEQVKEIIKEKASKANVIRDYKYVVESVRNNEMRLDQILNGFDIVIERKIANKAELKDLEILD